LAIGKAGGFHRISFKSNNLEILLLSQVKGWGYYHITKELKSSQINRIYKRLAKDGELPQEIIDHISGHSMRVGAAQDLLKSGASMPMIMNKGRWSKIDTVMRYLEQAN